MSLGYCPNYVLDYGLFIRDICEKDGGLIDSILYFPDVNKVMYYSEKLSCRYSFEDEYSKLLKDNLASQLYFMENCDKVFDPEILYDIVSTNKDIDYTILELNITDYNYTYKIEMYKIYIDWYNNYYVSNTTENWKQISLCSQQESDVAQLLPTVECQS